MRTLTLLLLIGCALVGGYFGLLGISSGPTAIQEIEGLIGVLIVTVVAAAGYIVSAIDKPEYPRAPVYPPPPPPVQ